MKLTKEGQKITQDILKKFNDKVKEEAKRAVEDFYVDFTSHIESDAWFNIRNQLLKELCNYNDNKYKSLRGKIFEEHKEEIQNDIIKDLNKEIEILKSNINSLENSKW